MNMITRIKPLHFFKLVLLLFIIALMSYPLNAGDKEYIEIEIDGETVGKWMEFASLSEYNSDGKISYTRYSAAIAVVLLTLTIIPRKVRMLI